MILKTIVKENVRKCLINSSNVKASEYDLETRDLLITFKNDAQYMYRSVGPEDYIRFEGADSQGKVLNGVIKGAYEFEKVEDFKPIDEDLYKDESETPPEEEVI